MFKRIKNWIVKMLPGYSWPCLIVLVLFQCSVFWATRPILARVTPMDLSIPLDDLIPFRPAWILIYILSFASWFITFFLLFRQRREHVYRNSAAYFLTLLLTGAMFCCCPGPSSGPRSRGRASSPRLPGSSTPWTRPTTCAPPST